MIFSKAAFFSIRNEDFFNAKMKIGIAIALGLLNGFALAPLYLWWFAFISFSGFFVLIRSVSIKTEAIFVSLAYFVSFYLNKSAVTDLPYYTIAVFSVCFGYGLLSTFLVGFPTWLLRNFPIIVHWILFSGIWGIWEWIMGHSFGGLPWNTISYITLSNEIFAQTASLWGIYGLVIPTVLVITSPAVIYLAKNRKEQLLCAFISVTIFAGAFIYGKVRLENSPIAYWPDIALRLVQTNFDNQERGMEQTLELLDKHIEQTFKDDHSSITAFIWPESAINHHYIDEVDQDNVRYNRFINDIGKKVSEKSYLIAGFFRASIIEVPPFEDNLPSDIIITKRSHGLGVVGQKGLLAWHAKHHLLPFGEYIPFVEDPHSSHSRLEGTNHNLLCVPGPGPSYISVPGLPSFAPIICFEAIFPKQVVSKKEERPSWLLVIANDHNYRNTRFVYWMREMSRMRAIEEGLPMVRVTNWGTSTVFDSLGRTLVDLDNGKSIIADVQLPKPNSQATFYGKHGDLLFWMMLIGICPLLVYRTRIKKIP